GWVSFDVSETQKLAVAVRARTDLSDKEKETLTNAARRRLTRGFRDNTWFSQTRGTDYDLVPAAKNRAAVVRTIFAEADGKALPDPDPSNIEETRFSWMTSHRFQADRVVKYPFTDVESLQEWVEIESKSKPKN
ncbi:MAG: transglutaminase domain-containing protein, partial [Planctomycetota bacterium]|nr:transglutaminase domain-containing protein [Planctomycetota bacterium]